MTSVSNVCLGGSTISGAGLVKTKKNSVPSWNRFQEIQRKTFELIYLIFFFFIGFFSPSNFPKNFTEKVTSLFRPFLW